MKTNRLSPGEWIERIVVALLFVAIGSLIILVFSPWRPLLGRVNDYLGRVALIVLLLVAALWLRRSERYRKHTQVLVGLLIMAVAVSLDWIFGVYLLDYLGVNDNVPAGWTLPKLNECALVIGTVILLTRTSGGSLGSIYIQKGRLKLGLTIGLIAFFVAAAGSIPMATLFNARELTLARIVSWAPWLLSYVLANGLMEEILFRGLFLRKLEPFCGRFLANFLIAFVFTALHGTVTYSADTRIFVAVTFPLALAWGYVMQKTDSVWGSALFHAGMDIPIMLGIFSNLP